MTTKTSVPTALNVARRFAGPPGIGNGGYSCGRFAGGVHGPAEVTLRAPVALERQLDVRPGGDGTIEVTDGDLLVAEVRPIGPLTGLEPPARPTLSEAAQAAAGSAFNGPSNPFRTCFVCGPDHADGLHLHPGAIEGAPGVQAAPLRPLRVTAGPGALAPEIVWAALDCPSFPVTRIAAGVPHLLARLSVERLAPVPAHAASVVVGWEVAAEGRKLHTASAILSAGGEVLARARALWIALRPEQASALVPATRRTMPRRATAGEAGR